MITKNNFNLSNQISNFSHEEIIYCNDEKLGLKAIIGIHSTTLGPSIGGTRMWNYKSEKEALNDVLRLSRAMTLKSSLAGLNAGGGKAVIIFDGIINYDKIIVKDKYDNVLDYEDLKSIRFKKSDSKDKYDLHDYRYLQSFNKEDGSLKFTSRWRHAHNEWLNVLAENGVAGIILLTLLFTFPIKIFWQNLSHENDLVATYSYCGTLLIVSFAIFGQTQSMFTSHAVVIFFIFFLFLFIAQISRLSYIDDNHDSVS